MRQCLAEALSPARRRQIHGALARALQAANAPPALVAAQLEGAGQGPAAVPWRIQAAQAALRVHAHADAVLQYHQALADGATPAQAVAIHLGVAEVQRVRGDAGAVEAALVAAVAAADPADPASRLQARLTRAEHGCSNEQPEDGLATALTLVGLAAMMGRNDSAGARVALERARALAAACGHVPAQRAALLNLVKLHTDSGRTAEALALLPAELPARQFEDSYQLAWVGAAAALALSDVPAAAQRLQGIDIEAPAPTDVLANILVQRLALARARGQHDPAAHQRAQSLLAEGRVPAFNAQALQVALQG